MKLKKSTYFINIDSSAAGAGWLAGRRMAVLSDFHNRDCGPVLEMLRNDTPDVILIPGDLVLGYFPEGDEYVIDRCKNITPFLEACCEIAPTYMSVGNHECLLCEEEFDRLRATGAIILNNEWTELEEGVLIGGLTSALVLSYNRFRDEYNSQRSKEDHVRYPYRKRPKEINKFRTESAWLEDFEQADGYKILLCHHPEYWGLREPMVKDRKIDLVLSGHAHGGQMRLFGRGIISPGQGFLPKFTSGIHQGPHGSMIISRGLSNPYRLIPRLGNPCEVVYVQFAADKDCRCKK